MSYWIQDSKGKFLGDFATVAGAFDMLEGADTPPVLKRFLATGRADADTAGRIIEVTGRHPSLNYIAKLFRRAKKFPVRLCDGVNNPCNVAVLRAGMKSVDAILRAFNTQAKNHPGKQRRHKPANGNR